MATLRHRYAEASALGRPPGLVGRAQRWNLPLLPEPDPVRSRWWATWVAAAVGLVVALATRGPDWPLRAALAMVTAGILAWTLLRFAPVVYLLVVFLIAGLLFLPVSPIFAIVLILRGRQRRQRDRRHPNWGRDVEIPLLEEGPRFAPGGATPWSELRCVWCFADGLLVQRVSGVIDWLPYSALGSGSPAAANELLRAKAADKMIDVG